MRQNFQQCKPSKIALVMQLRGYSTRTTTKPNKHLETIKVYSNLSIHHAQRAFGDPPLVPTCAQRMVLLMNHLTLMVGCLHIVSSAIRFSTSYIINYDLKYDLLQTRIVLGRTSPKKLENFCSYGDEFRNQIR